MNRLDST